jgi:hypothetical protein
VVDAFLSPVPEANSSKAPVRSALSGAAVTVRFGTAPPSARRRSAMYTISGDEGSGRRNGASAIISSEMVIPNRSRKYRRSSSFIFFCW